VHLCTMDLVLDFVSPAETLSDKTSPAGMITCNCFASSLLPVICSYPFPEDFLSLWSSVFFLYFLFSVIHCTSWSC